MKKITKMSLISLFALSLFGCNRNLLSSLESPSNPASSNAPSNQTSSEASSEASSEVLSSEAVSSSEESTSSSSSSVNEDEVNWGNEISTLMKENLNGAIVPFVKIGERKELTASFNNSSSFSSTYVLIEGGAFSSDTLMSFVSTFEKKGYVVVTNDDENSLTAVNTALSLTVKISSFVIEGDSTTPDEYYFRLTAHYDEPYDKTKKTEFSEDEKTTIMDNLDGHMVPFVYLGSQFIYLSSNVYRDGLRMYGGKYEEQEKSDIISAFTADSWKQVENEDGFLSFTKTENDNCVLKMVFHPASKTLKSYIEFTYREGFYPESATDWSEDAKEEMKQDLDGHILPYMYLGTKNPAFDFDMNKKLLKITGGFYDSRVFESVLSALKEEDGYQKETFNGSYGQGLRFVKDFEDGCEISISIQAPSLDYKPETKRSILYVNYSPKCDFPTGDAADYDVERKKTITDFLNGHELPYVYLGDKKVHVSVSENLSTLTITPKKSQTFNNQMIEKAISAFESKGYTISKEYYTNNALISFEGTLTEEDGCQILVSMNAQVGSDIGPSTANLTVTYLEAYNPNDVTSYESGITGEADCATVKESMDKHFDGHSVPFIYLGAKRYRSSWNSTLSTLTLSGGNFNAKMIDSFKDAVSKDKDETATWSEVTETKDSTGLVTLSAVKTFTDTSNITMTLKQSSSSSKFTPTTLTFVYHDAYGTTLTDWDDTTKATIKKNFGEHEIPYVYLHKDSGLSVRTGFSQTSSSSDSIGSGHSFCPYVQIEGGSFDERIISEAASTYQNLGFTIDTSVVRYKNPSLEAYKKLDDGYILRVLVMASDSNSSRALGRLIAYLDKPITIPDSSYSESDLELMKSSLNGNTIPYIYPGLVYKATSNPASSSDIAYFQIKSDTAKDSNKKSQRNYFNFNYFLKAEETLKKEGYDVTLSPFNGATLTYSYAYNAKIEAKKENSDGSLLNLSFTFNSYAFTIQARYFNKYEYSATGEYSLDIKNKIKSCLGNAELPYLYLGCETPTFASSSESSNSLKLLGVRWDDAIFEDCIKTLKADSVNHWTTMYSYEKENGKVLLATGEFQDEKGNTHHLTLKLFKTSKNLPSVELHYVE